MTHADLFHGAKVAELTRILYDVSIPFVGVPFKGKPPKNKVVQVSTKSKPKTRVSPQIGIQYYCRYLHTYIWCGFCLHMPVQDPGRTDRKQKASHLSVRQSPLYDNAMLEAPDGQQLCVCDVKKAEW